jgi:hypothetical protein
MKTISAAVIALSFAAVLLAGCGQSDSGEGGGGGLSLLLMSAKDSLAEMSQSSYDAMTDAMSDINTSGATDLSYRVSDPGLMERLAMAEATIMEPFSAEAAAGVACPGGGTYDVTDPAGTWNNSGLDSFYITRTFNDCAGPYDLVSVSGSSLLHWTDMKTGVIGVNKLQAGSTVDQAPVNKRFTRVLNGDYVTVEGNGSSITNGVLTGTVAHTINWTTVGATTRSFTISTDLTRSGYLSNGTQIFVHTITTPVPLSVAVDMTALTRTMSGSVQVVYTLLGTTVTTTFASLVIPMNNCTVPTSGSATFVISGAGSGSGTITYNGNGTAHYSYTYTNLRGRTRNGSGTFTVSGCQ